MAALLRDAIRPNLVQTCEQTPALVHTGPFGNIAHGNSSILADLTAVRLADYVVTESGFGADCGAEKFFNIKCRASVLQPDLEVLVCTVRALKMQSGQIRIRPGQPLPEELVTENPALLQAGADNLRAHIDIVRQFGVPIVVAVNRFPTDTDRELATIEQIALDAGASATAVSTAFTDGSAGAKPLAEAVESTIEKQSANFRFLYPLDIPLLDKFETVAREIYGADTVEFTNASKRQLAFFAELGYGNLPVCIAKTQYSLSHDPLLLGRPRGFTLPIRDVRLASGAGFVYALAGDIRTMPGLPSNPAASRIDVDNNGQITGLS